MPATAPAEAREDGSHDADTTDRAASPAPVADEPHLVLSHQDTGRNAIAGEFAQGHPAAEPRCVSAGDPQRPGVAECARIAAALAGQDRGVGDLVASVEVEGNRVEPGIVVLGTSAAAPRDGA